jgi:hypothetical protein
MIELFLLYIPEYSIFVIKQTIQRKVENQTGIHIEEEATFLRWQATTEAIVSKKPVSN